MKAAAEPDMLTGTERRELQPQEAAAEADMAERVARLKEEQEEQCVSEEPLMEVKKEEDRGERLSELELRLFAPVEFSDELEWPTAAGEDEAAKLPRRRLRGRRKRTRTPRGRRQVTRAAASRKPTIEESDGTDESHALPPPGKCAKSNKWDVPSQKSPRSAVWDYYEYFINPDGELENYGFPTCKLCQQKVAFKRGNTSNMLRHLQDNHSGAYWETKRADALWLDSDSSDPEMKTEREERNQSDDWLSLEKQSDADSEADANYRERGYSATPRRRRPVRSAVWNYFHHADKESVTERRPSCKLCGWRVTAGSTGSTSNMRQHLQNHHKIFCPLTKSAAFTGPAVAVADGDEPLKLHPPSTPRKSPVWKLFGFLMNPEGVVEENGFPVCRLCNQVVACKDGNTSNMYSHLQHHHQAVYAELKHTSPAALEQRAELNETIELHPPERRRGCSVWNHFGFIRGPDGELKEDGFPLCKLCYRRVAARDGTTSNMLNHLRRHHQAEYEEVKVAADLSPLGCVEEAADLPELHPPSSLPLSPIWDYFGYPKNTDGAIEESERPKCKACRQSIVSKQGILSNMLRHLKFYHDALFQELKSRTGHRRQRQYKERNRAPPVDANPGELYPPKTALRSGVWKHFGYLKNSRGVVVPDGFPVCKLCLRKVSTPRGCTTNMMVHLQRHHVDHFTEIRAASDDNDEQVSNSAEEPASEEAGLFAPQDVLEPVWEHFGYLKDKDGNVNVDGQPTCKLCGVKVSCPGQSSKFLYKHLWKKHNAVYVDIKVASRPHQQEEEVAESAPVLFPPTYRVKSAVWEFFGYLKNPEGAVVCDGFPICKICHLNIAAKGGNTTNLFKHLKDHHKSIYNEIRPSVPDEFPPYVPSSALHAPIGQTSKIWDYFGYRKSLHGVLQEDGGPTCKICSQKLRVRGETMDSMMRHLQEHHEILHREIQALLSPPQVDPSAESADLYPPTQSTIFPVWDHFGFLKDAEGAVVFDGFPICKLCRQRVEAQDGDTTNMFQHLKLNHLNLYQQIKPASEKKVYKPLELSPPSGRQMDICLWEHFGYPKNAEGEVEEDGAPVCKICLHKLTRYTRGGNLTTNMLRHLRRHHQSIYDQVQEDIGAWRPDLDNETLELHPPTQNVTSPVWDYFGYLQDAEGTVVCDGYPICKICHQKVPSKGGNTTNMFKHLKDTHRSSYNEIRSAVTSERFEDIGSAEDLHPPGGQTDAPLWEHFGYRRNSDGALEEDGAPFCKLCLRKLVSRGETTRNMKQHLKENHNEVYTEPEEIESSFDLALDTDSSNLYPPTQKVKSAAWKFFGYPRDAAGSVQCDGFPICKLCEKKVSAKGGNTTNMFTHLRDYHRTTYNEIKTALAPPRPENELEPMELHLPSSDALSPAWKYFGYPKAADGELACDGYPVCRICQQKVIAKGGSSTYMMMHLRAYHLDVYKEVKPAVSKKSIFRPLDLFPPSGQGDIKLWDHFGYPRDAEGELQDDGAPICKICLRKLMKPPSGGAPTNNMLKHLRKKHQSVYNEVQEAITTLRTEWGIEPPELHPPTHNVTSAVWEYFGYLKDAGGAVVCDDFPICKLCQQKVASKSRCTTNMFKHLKDYHRQVYDEVRSAVTSQTFEEFLPSDLHPPSGKYHPKLWEHFGYRKSEAGVVEDDGAPICKLCLRKLVSKGETTSNMMQHLKENHAALYTEVQREVNIFTIGGATELPELHPPEHRVRSGVWKYFGYIKDAEGPAECAGYPICKICLSKVSNKGKVTANMSAHLKDQHRGVYDELKIPDRKSKVVVAENLPALFPPSQQHPSPIWEHFGLPKNEDGVIEEDACPVCRVCGKTVSSQDARKMLRHLHFCHFAVYERFKNTTRASKLGLEAGGRASDLHPPSKNVRSSAWEYFGYLKNADGSVNVDGRPICKTCFQKVSSHGGNTTNMFKHLEDKHGFSQ